LSTDEQPKNVLPISVATRNFLFIAFSVFDNNIIQKPVENPKNPEIRKKWAGFLASHHLDQLFGVN
jgi:hypothetical protein